MLELIKEFRKDVSEDYLHTVLELEELNDVYPLDEFKDSDSVLTKIDDLRRKLDSSATIPNSKQHRLHILLKDINQNCHHVKTDLNRLSDEEGEEHLSFTLKQLALEELLSEEQHLEHDKVLVEDELDSSRILNVIKGTKVGQGLNILPRNLNDLVKSLQFWLDDFVETEGLCSKRS